MSSAWVPILIAALGCYGLKLAGVSLPESALNHPRIQRLARLLPVAMLSALIATELFDHNRSYSFDWTLVAGILVAVVALRLGRSLIVVFLVAIAVTAILRLIT